MVPTAEKIYEKGLVSLRQGQTLEAMAEFEAAMRRDREVSPGHPTMKYRSFYGLCLALITDRHRDALELCRQAAEAEFYNPEVFWNLGRVALLRGDRRGAFKAFVRGLEIDRGHPGLRFEIRRLGLRRRPLFAFLGRDHALNRLAGRFRNQLTGRAQPLHGHAA